MENRDIDDIVIYATTDSETDYNSEMSDLFSEVSSYDSDDLEIVDEIYGTDINHIDTEKVNNNYYLGFYQIQDNSFVLTCSISINTYLRYNHNDCVDYLFYYGDALILPSRNIEIMKLKINEDGVYNVILKTFWLKIIQRAWKSRFKKRKQIIAGRRTPVAVVHRETHGKWPKHLQKLPSLKNLLFC